MKPKPNTSIEGEQLYKKLGNCHPKLKRGLVQCRKCKSEKKVNSAICFKKGWPQCCSETMILI